MKDNHNTKQTKKFGSIKFFTMLMAITLILCTIIGGTVAWLITETEPVVNTFTYGDINIELNETDTNLDGDDDPNTNDYQMIPGKKINKDPKVTVLAGSENAWLFVKLEKTENFDNFMTYEIADGWTALDGNEGVYYRIVDKAATKAEYYVIKNNTVNVKGEVTKGDLNALDADGAKNYPRLTVTAYAVQRDSNIANADDAWAKILVSTNP